MRILLDTNVLLSAAWRDRLPEKVVQFVATHAGCQWIVTAEILKEYLEVLPRPKFGLSPAVWQQWSELIDMRTLLLPATIISSLATAIYCKPSHRWRRESSPWPSLPPNSQFASWQWSRISPALAT